MADAVFRAKPLAVLAAAALLAAAFLLAAPLHAQESGREPAFASLIKAQGLPEAVQEALESVWPDEFIEARAVDLNGDGVGEIVARRGDHCAPIGGGLGAACLFGVLAFDGGGWKEILSVTAWRSLLLVSGGRAVGLRLDGVDWTMPAGSLKLVPDGRRPVFGSLDRDAWPLAPAAADAVWEIDLSQRLGPGASLALAREPAADTGTLHYVTGGQGKVLASLRQPDAVLVSVTDIGLVLLHDGRGEVHLKLWLPVAADVWRQLYANPDLPDGWIPVLLDESLASETPLDEESRSHLALAGRDCGNAGCVFSGHVKAMDGVSEPVLFDGSPSAVLCPGPPDHLAVNVSAARLRACGVEVRLSSPDLLPPR